VFEEKKPVKNKILVICGVESMAYGFGVPERIFKRHKGMEE
jgi:hypothetical protein